MKKIFAIVISLLFVVSVFGVAQTMAREPCKSEIIGPTTVQVGDTFQVKVLFIEGDCCMTYSMGIKGSIEYVCSKPVCEGPEPIPGGYLFTFKALKPGTYKFISSGCPEDEKVYYTVTVIQKEYPMHQFMKILGFGKKK